MPCDRGTAIGIDLGTTYSCVGVFQDGEVHIAANDQGNRSTPSYVAFTDAERLIGDPAEAQIALNPENTVFAAKRLMGGQYEDSRIQTYVKHWPFRLVSDREKPKIKVHYKGEVKHFNPEEISAMVLTKMKLIAEEYVGHKVEHAVISVPAYFNDSQRQATIDAGKIAGLNVLRIINETTAAALAYGLDRNLRGERNILMFDLGGGSFDVSVLTVAEGSLFEVKATSGNTHLGGEDFTNRLSSYFIEEFKQKYGKDIHSNKRAMVRLRTACERAKRTLSSCSEARVEIDALCDGVDFYTKITRPKFEELCIDLFRSILEPVERVLKDANLEISGVHDVVLVGGCTRIPKIQKLLRDFFKGKELCMSINPEEAVAYGAAVQAAVLAGDLSENIKDVLLVDVAPLSVGIEADGGIMTKVIEKNSRIPCHTSHVITTYSSSQTEIEIQVYEGEWRMTKNNNLLGTFELRNLQLVAGGISQIELMFDLDANCILRVSAFGKGTDGQHSIKIIDNKGRLSSKEIERMIVEAKQYEEDDQEQRDKVAARNSLESYVYSVKEVINCISDDSLSSDDKSEVKETCDEVVQWLDTNAVAERDEIEHKTKEVQSRLSHYMIKLHQNTKSSTVSSNGALFEEVA